MTNENSVNPLIHDRMTILIYLFCFFFTLRDEKILFCLKLKVLTLRSVCLCFFFTSFKTKNLRNANDKK